MVAGGGAVASSMGAEWDMLLAGRDTRWYKGRIAKLNLIILLLLITSMTNGYDGSMMNGLQALDTWKNYFGNPQGSLLGVFNAIQSIGGIVGLPFAPWIADRFGRRATIFLGACIMLIGTAVQTAAQNVGMFIGCRFLIGFGLAFSCLAAPILITELAFPTQRGPLTSLYNSSWYLGSIVAAWATYGSFRLESTWAWRIPSVLQGLPSIAQFCLIWFIPESPRWLIDHGREEQAQAVICKYHANDNYDDPIVEYEIREIKEAIRMEKEAKANSTYRSLFMTPGNRRRMRIIIAIAFFSQWSGNGLVSYYFTIVLDGIGIKSEGQQTLLNGILQVYNYGTAIIGALVVDKAGRRVLFLTSTAGMCISYAVWTAANATYYKSAQNLDANGDAINPNKAAGNTVLAMIFFYYGFYNIALSPLLVSYTVEILPFRIRAKGLMVMQMCVNASLVFNQYVNPIAMKALNWKYYIVYVVWIAFEFVYLWFFCIETKGKNGPLPLEEIAALFDGEDQIDRLQRTGAQGGPVASPLDEKSSDIEKNNDVYIEQQRPVHQLA